MGATFSQFRRGRLLTAAAVTGWVVVCVGGLAALAAYQSAAGPAAPARRWPTGTSLHLNPTADTLLLVIHPKCPCSRATIDNLAVLLAHCPAGRVATTVLFVRPDGVPDGWERTDLWTSAAAIPGVTVTVDAGGREADRFGAITSGQALLFDPAGRLRFRGGITPGRGHGGDSGGADGILAVVRGDSSDAAATPVFGCPLVNPAADSPRTAEGRSCRP